MIKHIVNKLKVRLLSVWNIFYVWSSSINVKIRFKVFEHAKIKFLLDHRFSEISAKWYWTQKCSYFSFVLFEMIFSAENFKFKNLISIVMNAK